MFEYCSKLVNVQFPKVEIVSDFAFRMCSGLKKVVLPACKEIQGVLTFQQANGLKLIDMLGGDGGDIACNLGMYGSVSVLVLRATDGVTGLSGALAKTTQIYVPDELVEQYKTATNWSTYADQIAPLSTYVEEV